LGEICSLLIGPTNCFAENIFLHIFVDDCQAHGLVDVPVNDFNGFVKIESKTFESMLEFLPQHGGLWRNIWYTKIVALQLATYQRLCLNGCFLHLSGST
jgi:hypothetical protein